MTMNTRLLIACISALVTVSVAAAPAPCQLPPEAPQLRLGVERGDKAGVNRQPDTDVSVARYRFAYRAGGARADRVRLGSLGHEYTDIDFEPFTLPGVNAGRAQPSTNGHVHTAYLSLDISAWLPESWSMRVQPAVSVASDIIKVPKRIDVDGLQLNLALLRRFGSADNGNLVAGLCADHRFGSYRVYPSLAWQWQGGRWSILAGFPDTRIQASVTSSLASGIRVFPAGNRWYIRDQHIGNSYLTHRAWQAHWYLEWRPADPLSVELNLGTLFASKYEFRLDNGMTIQAESNEPLQIGLSLIWWL